MSIFNVILIWILSNNVLQYRYIVPCLVGCNGAIENIPMGKGTGIAVLFCSSSKETEALTIPLVAVNRWLTLAWRSRDCDMAPERKFFMHFQSLLHIWWHMWLLAKH